MEERGVVETTNNDPGRGENVFFICSVKRTIRSIKRMKT
jgi:hypothetical protein